MIDVRVIREPLTRAVDVHRLPVGLSVSGIVDRVTNLPHARVLLARDGIEWEVRPEYFAQVRPTPGTTVTVAPHIGATALVPVVASALGVSTLTASVIVAGVAVGLSLLAQFMFAPKDRDNDRDKQNPTVRGLQNTFAVPGQPLPMVLGRHRMAPQKVATGYTQLVGQTVYRRERMTFGVALGGKVALEEIRIGTTPINRFRNVEIQLRGVDEARTRAAMPALDDMDCTFLADDEVMTLYSRNIFEDAEEAKLSYNQPVERDTPANTIRARVQFSFRGLVKITDKGKKLPRTRRIGIYYRAAGTEDAWVTVSEKFYTGKTTATKRFGEAVTFPSAGDWTIKVVRLSKDDNDDQVYDDSYLDGIQSEEPGDLPSIQNTAEIAIRIKATDQINGSLDPVNAVVTQLAPVWTGESWSDPEPVTHPADIAVALLRGPVRKRVVSDDRIDLAAFRAWKLAHPQWRYDGVVTEDLTLGAMVDQVLAVGLAMRDVRDGKHSVLTDQSDEPPVQMFTPRTTRDYSGELVKPPEVHAMRLRFTSERAGWKDDEVICYANGYDASTATEIETLEPPGLALRKFESVERIAQFAYYHLAQLQTRQTTVSFTADLDHILCGRGDPVIFVSDALRNTLGDGRIAGFTHSGGTLASITLDHEDGLSEGATAHLLWRANSGALQYVTATKAGDAWAVQAGSGVNPGGTFDGDDIARGNLATLYEVGTEAVKWLVKEIAPEIDGTARVTLTEATPVPLDDLSRPLPAYDPRVIAPTEPVGIAATIEYDGPQMYIVLRWGVLDPALRPRFRIVVSDEAGDTVWQVDTADTFARVPVQSVYVQTFTVSVTALNADDLPGEVKEITVSTSGEFDKPGDVSGLGARVVGEVIYLSWDGGAGNIDSYEVRYSPETSGATWATSVPILPVARDTEAQVPAQNGSYLVKAVSVQGEISSTASMAVVTSAGAVPNAVEVLDVAPDFDGDKTGGLAVLNGELLFASDYNFFEAANVFEMNNVFTDGREALSGTYEVAEVIDLGQVDTARLTARLNVFGYLASFNIFDAENVFTLNNVFGTDEDSWSVVAEVSTTMDDPSGAPVWSDWGALLVGDYRARAFRFRLRVSVTDPQVNVAVTGATFVVDMADRIEVGADIPVSTAGRTVTWSPPYRALTALTVNPQGLPSGGTWEISGKSAAGFTITLRDSAGDPVAGSFDYHAVGYGRQGA